AKYVFRPGVVMPSGEPLRHQGAGRATLAAIFYTSGTTGFPKGAMLSHENFLSNMESVFRVVPLERRPSVSLVTVPLFHVTAAISQMVPTLRYGGKLVILPGPDIKALIAAVAENRIDTVVSVPALYWYALVQPEFASLDKSGVKHVLYGGAPMPPDLVHKLMAAFPNARVGNGFGLTETASIATFLPHEYAGDHADSVGFPVPVTEVDLFEPDPHTGAGELLIRGPNVAMGYWNLPEATKETFIDGWLHTGDMARIEDGLVTIVDRKKDMINRGGENVYSVEVENVLAEYPGVLEVAVIGVPDEMMGEKVGAVVVPVPGVSFDVAEMISFARTKLADYKVPQYVWVRQEGLPRNPGGKVLKPRLRAEAHWEQVVF
ncbi:MAG: AMP-binding protein, partial [Nitrospiraceae bacterium]|nr:AMP-binding protein [Nitrospiraceae bacterium]